MGVHADGGFVIPKFVWDKHKDINEPTQKAIIAYDAGYEVLILQVKYEGPVEQFGWLIPVPNVPTITQGSMDCFYELSKYTQEHLERRSTTMRVSLGDPTKGQSIEPEPPVKVIEVKTVGAYQIAVLSAKDAGALSEWLDANGFFLPTDKSDVIDSYVKRGWYFVAARINLRKTDGLEVVPGAQRAGTSSMESVKEKLSSGELRPLHLGFSSDRCVFPLKISSINGKPSEVQIYLLSKEPLVEKRMFEIKMAEQSRWRTNMLAQRTKWFNESRAMQLRLAGSTNLPPIEESEEKLSDRSAVNEQDLIPYGEVSERVLPACSKEMMLPERGRCWLMKQTWTFKPEEMQDLDFVPAIPEFVSCLKDGEGAFAAANLAQLGTNGIHALLMATESENAAVRAHALAALESTLIRSTYPEMNQEILSRLPSLFKDKDPEVRLHAIGAAGESGSPRFFDAALELLRDDNSEVANAAVGYLRLQRYEAAKRIPLLHQMLKDTNVVVQMAGLRLLFLVRVKLPREELLPLFSAPRMEVAGLAYQILKPDGVSPSEAKPLLQNPAWMVRLLGLRVLNEDCNNESVELAMPLLREKEPFMRERTCALLTLLTGQNIPADQPERWEKWWSENKATFVVDPEKVAQRREEEARQRQEAARRRYMPETPQAAR